MTTTTTKITVRNAAGTQDASLDAPGNTFTVQTLLQTLSASFVGTAPVGVVLQGAMGALLSAGTNLIQTVGTPVTVYLVPVSRFTLTWVGQTNPAQSTYVKDYIPTNVPAASPTRLADFVTMLVGAFGAPTGSGQVYGLQVPGQTKILVEADVASAFLAPGSYNFLQVVQYKVRSLDMGLNQNQSATSPPASNTVTVQYAVAQDASVLIALSGLPSGPYIGPQLFLDDGSLTAANIASKQLSGQQASGNYLVQQIYNYKIDVPKDTILAGDLANSYLISFFQPQLAYVSSGGGATLGILNSLGSGSPLTFTAANFGLYDANGVSQAVIQPFIPPGEYTMYAVIALTIHYPATGYGSSVVYNARQTETVAEILGNVALQSVLASLGLDDSHRMVLYNKSTSGTMVQLATTALSLQQQSLTSLYEVSESVTQVTAVYAGSTQPNFSFASPASQTVGDLKSLVNTYYGLTENQETQYWLFDHSNPGHNWSGSGVTSTVSGSGVTNFDLIEMLNGMVSGTDGTTKKCWVPKGYNCANMAAYIAYNATNLSLTVAALGANQDYFICNSNGNLDPFMPWQLVSDVTQQSYNFREDVQTVSSLDLVTPVGSTPLGLQSIKFQGGQLITWAKHLYPNLDPDNKGSWVAATQDLSAEPTQTVIGLTDEVLESHLATVTDVYIDPAVAVVVNPPESKTTTLTPLSVSLPSSFNGWDMVNYAATQFNFTGLAFSLTVASDPAAMTIGQDQTLLALSQQWLPSGPLVLNMSVCQLTTPTIVFNNVTSVLRDQADTTTIGSVMQRAEIQLGLAKGQELEVTDPQGVLDSDTLSKYSKTPSTTGGSKTVQFTVQQRVLVQAVLLDPTTGKILYNPKVSERITLQTLLNQYMVAQGINPSVTFAVYNVTLPSTSLPLTTTLQNQVRSVQPASDIGYLDQTDDQPVNQIAIFNVVSTTATVQVNVQNLFNIGQPAAMQVQKFTKVKELANLAAAQFNLTGGTNPASSFTVVIPTDLGNNLDPNSIVDPKVTYQLVETSSPRNFMSVTEMFVNRNPSVPNQTGLFLASTPMNTLPNFDINYDKIALSATGQPLGNLGQPVSSQANPVGAVQLFIVQNPDVAVQVTWNGATQTLSVPVRAHIVDVLTAAKITTPDVKVTYVPTGAVANVSDSLVPTYSSPFTFNVVPFALPRTVSVTYKPGNGQPSQTAQVQVADGYTVAQVISAAMLAFNLASGTYNLSADGRTTLPTTAVEDFTTITSFTLMPGVSGQTFVIAAGALAVLLRYFGAL